MSQSIKNIRDFFYDPRLKEINVDDPRLIDIHNIILSEKKILKSAFNHFYDVLLKCKKKYITGSGIEIELGAGVGFLKEKRKNIIATDIRKSKKIDKFLNAQKMNLNANSVSTIYAINVFHHLSDPNLFFSEAIRVLAEGGGVILIEPHNGFSSSLIHKHLHKNEKFDVHQKSWSNHKIKGPLSGANQALSYIIFERDKEKFIGLYGGELEIRFKGYINNYLRYFFSGGLNFRQLSPNFLLPLLRLIELLLIPFSRFLSLHEVIVLVKKRKIKT